MSTFSGSSLSSMRSCCFSLFHIIVNWIPFWFWTLGWTKQAIWMSHFGLWEIALAISWTAQCVLTIWAERALYTNYRFLLQKPQNVLFDYILTKGDCFFSGCTVFPFRWNSLSIPSRLSVYTYTVGQFSAPISGFCCWSDVQRESSCTSW